MAAHTAVSSETGGRCIDPTSEADAALRKKWLDAYGAAGGAVEEVPDAGRPLTNIIQPCPLWQIDLLYQYVDGSPVGGATYVIRSHTGHVLYQGKLGQDGRTQIKGVPPEHRTFLLHFRDDPAPYKPFLKTAEPPKPEDKKNFIEEVADWLWGALQGDFNKDPTYGQIAFNTVLGVIPILDTLLDVRDLTAGILSLTDFYNQSEQKKQQQNKQNSVLGLDYETLLWLGVFITAIGYIPELGSVIKGVLQSLLRYLKGLKKTVTELTPQQLRELWELLVKGLNKLGIGNAHEWLKQFSSKLDGWMAQATQRIQKTLNDLRVFCQQLTEALSGRWGWTLSESQRAAVVATARKLMASLQKVQSRIEAMRTRVNQWQREQMEKVLEGKHHWEKPGTAGTHEAPVHNTRQQEAVELPPVPPPKKGTMSGHPTRIPPGEKDPKNISALTRENESAKTLTDHGYDVEQNPPTLPNGRNPDYRIGGEYYDCYAPSNSNPRNIASYIEKEKVLKGQADKVILNLDDSKVTMDAMKKQLTDYPIAGLKEVLVVRGGDVSKLFP
ncbi:MAG TPA: hypothetical protein VEU33_47810 [Archangium sp.]|nr:hypothetical protein [Archangium sp.]